MPKPSSRDHIVDTATRLLARRGLAVSLREINEACGLSAAAVHYHFKNREALINAVLRSRMPPIEEREAPIDRLLASRSASVDEVAELMVDPLGRILLADPERGRDYVRVVARVYAQQGQAASFPLIDEFRLPVGKLIQALQRALPEVSEQCLQLRYGFALETMLNSLANATFPSHLASSSPRNEDLEQLVAELKRFIAAGFAGRCR